MSDPERRALTLTLLGTGKRGEPPGPLDAGWVVKHLAGTRTTLQRWRERGVPPDRLDDLIDAVHGLLPNTEKPTPEVPEWARALQEKVDSIYQRQETVATSVASNATQQVIAALTDPERVKWAERIAAEIRAESEKQSGEGSDGQPTEGDQGGVGPAGPGLGSLPARDSAE